MYKLQEKAIAIARNILVSEFHYAPLHVAGGRNKRYE